MISAAAFATAIIGWWLALAFWLEEDPASIRRVMNGLRLMVKWVGREAAHRDGGIFFVWSVDRVTLGDEMLIWGSNNCYAVKEYNLKPVGPWWRRRWRYFLKRYES